MVWACGKNGRVPYGQKGVDYVNKWRRVRGRPRLGWMDGVKVDLGNRGMTVEATRQCAKDRKEWRVLVHMQLNEFQAAIFTWHCSFGLPSHALVVITWRGVGCRYMMRLG